MDENSNGEFRILDWRQDFAGLIEYGDIYYDLAKLYGGMNLSYQAIKDNKFSFEMTSNEVFYRYSIDSNLMEAKDVLNQVGRCFFTQFTLLKKSLSSFTINQISTANINGIKIGLLKIKKVITIPIIKKILANLETVIVSLICKLEEVLIKKGIDDYINTFFIYYYI